VLDIPSFEGNRPITELDHYPLPFADDASAVKARLAARGKKVLQYQGLTYCEYEGLGLYSDDACQVQNEKHNASSRPKHSNNPANARQVYGRILIDTYGYQKHHQALKRTSGKDHDSKKRKARGPPPPPTNQNIDLTSLTHMMPIFNNVTAPGTTTTTTNTQVQDSKKDDFYIKRLSEEEQKKNREEMLARPDDLIFLSPMLTGYALKNKLWCKSLGRSAQQYR
jgi:hypothetical protein